MDAQLHQEIGAIRAGIDHVREALRDVRGDQKRIWSSLDGLRGEQGKTASATERIEQRLSESQSGCRSCRAEIDGQLAALAPDPEDDPRLWSVVRQSAVHAIKLIVAGGAVAWLASAVQAAQGVQP